MYGYFGWKQNATASAEAAGKVRGALEMQAGALSTALRDAKAKRDDDATAPTPASAAATSATSAAALSTRSSTSAESARESASAAAAAPSGAEQADATPVSKKARGRLYNKFQDPSAPTKSAESASPPALVEDDGANQRRVSRRQARALSLLFCVAALGLLQAWLTAAQVAAGVAMAQKWLAALVQLPAQGVGAVTGATRAGLSAVARAILGAVGLTWSPS